MTGLRDEQDVLVFFSHQLLCALDSLIVAPVIDILDRFPDPEPGPALHFLKSIDEIDLPIIDVGEVGDVDWVLTKTEYTFEVRDVSKQVDG